MSPIARSEVIDRLEHEYQKMKDQPATLYANHALEIRNYVNTLPSAPAAQTDRPEAEASTSASPVDRKVDAPEIGEDPSE
jgi:hypothetical protein